ncbi:MDR family MFS transporter [Brevibacillus borstelensis]|uniref:MDR family MFS transporter n=1 Tax=Brevibacillus borstelensis TaxID=45462 RepID=UPI0030BC8549
MGFLQLHPAIRIRILTSFLTRAVGTMIFPFMAIYFSEKLGQGLAGVLMLANVAAQIVTSFYGGYFADRWGRKKVMVYAQAVQLFAFATMTLANSPLVESAWLTFAMMLVQGACNGMINPAADAMLIDVSTAENRGLMYSINYWSVNLSIAIGAMFGGLLFATHRFELFFSLTLVGLLTLALTAFFIEETYRPDPKHDSQKKGTGILRGMANNYSLVMKDKLFVLYSLGGLLLLSLELQTANYVGVRLQQEFVAQQFYFPGGFSLEITGIKVLSMIQLLNTVTVISLAMYVTKLIKRFDDKRVLYAGFFLYTVGYSIIGCSNTLWLIAAAVLVATVGELMYVPVRQTYLAEIVKAEARSSYMAVNGLVIQGAKAFGALGISVGAVLPSGAMAALYFLMGMAGLLLTRFVLIRYGREKSSRTHRGQVSLEA